MKPQPKQQPKDPVCPCCGHRLPSHDRDGFASVFRIWSHAHRIALDMNGAAKSEAIAMMLRWERMFRDYMDPLPSSEELKLATDYMLQTEANSKAPWLAHFAIVKTFITTRRSQMSSKMRIEQEEKERLDYEQWAEANPDEARERSKRWRDFMTKLNGSTELPEEDQHESP